MMISPEERLKGFQIAVMLDKRKKIKAWMILLIGIIVGFIVLAMFGPIAGAISELSKPKHLR